MRRIGIRELRNDASRVVRQASSGERMVITIDGIPAAQIGPLNDGAPDRTLDDLIVAGLVLPSRAKADPRPAHPIEAPGGRTTTEILRAHRER
jgi:antitoxin (DNA-binding transcriptional repressor) of toxin-antitoxin stability system